MLIAREGTSDIICNNKFLKSNAAFGVSVEALADEPSKDAGVYSAAQRTKVGHQQPCRGLPCCPPWGMARRLPSRLSRRRVVHAVRLSCAFFLAGCATGELHPPSQMVCEPTPPSQARSRLLVAGSGAALALARTALRGRPVRVAASIGSSGAIAAVRAGAVDVGLSLRAGPSDLRSTKLAEISLVLATGATSSAQSLRLSPLTASLQAQVHPDAPPELTINSSRPRWISREAGDSGLRVLAAARPALAAALADARGRGLALIAHTDQEQHALLAATPGAVGLVDLGTVRLTSAPLRTYPPEDPRLVLTLYALTALDCRPKATSIVQALQDFAGSEEAHRAGYRR